MVPAEGKDGEEGKPGTPGADGITPLLQINADFYWEVSLDEGKTWKPVIGADGKPVLAQGPKGEQGAPGQDGDANLTITETDDVVIIVYRGVTYTISKSVQLLTMTFTTSKNEGEKIIIWFDASEADRPDVWIDLNNNGERDPGEEVVFRSHRQYTVVSRTVTVHGKVTEFELPVAPLTELDVSKNPHLVKLVCGGGALESIDLSANTELTEFHCFNNQLASLDVSNNTKLKNLSCYGNNISDTDMEVLVNSLPDRTGKEIGEFKVINPTSPDEGNDITADQIAKATAKNWQVLDASGNPYTLEQPKMVLTTTKAVGETILLTVYAAEADRSDVWIDLNNNDIKDDGEAVTVFGSDVNYPLGAQTVTIYGKVTDLYCQANQLTSLDVSNNAALKFLWCPYNLLTSLDVSNEELISLNCSYNRLTLLDVNNSTKLARLSCHYNRLPSLDVSNNIALEELSCDNNPLTSLDVGNNTALKELLCYNNRLTSLDVSNNKELKMLWCYHNRISGDKMTALVNSLPDRKGEEAGTFRVINPASPDEGNDITADQMAKATAKNWSVLDYLGNPYTPGIDPDKLNGMWYWVKNEKPDGSGGWEISPGANKHGYWYYFKDASTVFYSILPSKYSYTLTEDHLTIGTNLDYIIVLLDNNNLVLEEKNGYYREHYTRGEIPPAIDPAKLIGKWSYEKTQVPDKVGGWKDDPSNDLSHMWFNFINASNGQSHHGEFTYTLEWNYLDINYTLGSINSYRIVEATDTRLVLEFVSAMDGTLLRVHCTRDVLNPLSLVAEYNVNPAGTGFVTDLTACNVSGRFTFDDAVAQFSNIIIGGKQYHLPSIEEWRSIVPSNYNHVLFQDTESRNNVSETVTVQGANITMKSDFRTGVNGVSYALRYKGTGMVSAWRYEYIEDGNNTHMKVTSRSLKGKLDLTVDDIAFPAFWSANAGNDVTRHFPASGFSDLGSLEKVGTDGWFWSSSWYSSSYAWGMYFRSISATSGSYGSFYRTRGLSVRLFSSGD